MIRPRPAAQRGRGDLDWLSTRYTFSFAGYFDPRHMGFRALRVINEDVVAPRSGFGMHSHEEMEILTWIVSGALTHQDSTGSGGTIRRGEAQRMSAGTGIVHGEWNHGDEPCHLLQIWLHPGAKGLAPSHEQRHFDDADLAAGLRLIAAPDGPGHGALAIHQDVRVFAARPAAGARLVHPLAPGRHAWLQLVTGRLTLNGGGDGPGRRRRRFG